MRKLLLLLTVLALGISGTQAQLVITPGGGAGGVASAVGGPGLTISNVTINCANVSYGSFSGGASSGLGITNGLVLTTGTATQIIGANTNNDFTGGCVGNSGNDPQLTALSSSANNDVCIIEFDVVPQCATMSIAFVFGSDEYTDYVNSSFNDAFGFFVSGPNPGGGNYTNFNLATIPGGTAVSIDNVSHLTNTAYFVNNNAGGANNSFDGFTTVLTPTMNVTPCATYHFKLAIADATDCAMDSGVMIDIIQCVSPWTVATSSTPASCGTNNGTATATVSGGIGPFSYSWAPSGGTGSTASGLAAGSYTVTVNDGLSCTPAQTYTVAVAGSGGSTTTVNSQTICAGASTTLTATPVTGGGTYSWAPGGATTQTITVSPASTTTYTVSYTLTGCTTTSTGTVTVNPVPTVNITPATSTICAGTSATLTANPSTGGGTFSWAPGGATTAAITVSPAATTTYTVTYTLAGCTATATRIITVNPSPTVSSNSQTICAGASATLTATPAPGGGTFSWAPGGATTAAITVSPAATTTYTVTYTLAGCTATGTGTVTVNPVPTVSSTSQTICAGSNATITATPSAGGGTFSWAPGGATTASITVSPAATTTYTVTYSLAGCTATGTGTVTVNPMPTVGVNSGSICPGGSIVLTGTGATSYVWSTTATTASITVSPGSTTSYTVTGTSAGCSGSAVATVTVGATMSIVVNSPSICAGQTANLVATGATSYTWSAGPTVTGPGTADVSPAATTSYTVTGTTGSCSGTGVATVTVNSVPVTTVDSPTICNGATATITAAGAASYTWSAGATGGGANTATAAPTTTTTYTVTGANGVCTSTAVSTVTVNPIPAVTVDSPTICAGQTATMTAAGAASYTWSAGATAGAGSTATASPAATTTYTVTGTSAGCTNTAVSTVTVAPSLNITVNSPTICAGQTANLSASGGTTYTWTAGATSTGANTADASPAATTSYTVTGTTAGCTGTAVSTVTVTPLPVVTVDSPTICAGDIATMTAAGATTYVWTAGATSSGANTATASPATTTTYTVTGTTSGCSASAVSTVNVNAIPTVTVNSPSICPGSTAQLTAGGATSYTWSAGATSTGVNTADASPASTTTYTVTGTTLGCTSSAVATVTVNTVLSVDAGMPDSLCFGESANLSVSPNGAGYTYLWAPAASLSDPAVFNPVATPAVTTTYSVTVTDPNGCTGSNTVIIYADPQITLALAGLPATCNGTTDGQTIVIPAGGSGSYTYSWSGGCNTAACNQAAGTYTVTVTDAWGCTATGSATVTEPTAVTATTTQVNVTCAGACNGTATATPTGGTPDATGAYNYSWNTVPVQATQTATGLCAGTYTVTITDDNGCSPSGPPITVTITEPTALAIDPVAALTICNSGSTPVATNVTGGTGTYTYAWTPATGLSSTTVSNPTASPATTTTYTVDVTDANGCTTQTTVLVNVNPPLSVVTAGTASVCPGFSAGISALASDGAGAGYTYGWTPATGLNDPAIAAPTATPAVTTTYTVVVNDGCSPSVSATVTVTVLPLPAPVITSSPTSGCAPLCVTFTDASTISSGTIDGWHWDFGDGTDSITQNTSHCFNTAGSYTVTLTDTSAAGCIATTVIPYVITVNPIPDAAFSAPLSTSIFTPTVQYSDESTVSTGSIVAWDWSFGDALATGDDDSSHLQNPSHLFSEIGTYCAELIVTTNAGCQDITTLCIVIDPEFTFFIPNAFSPNDDGINDEFYGKGEYIKKYEMNIYDRWGNHIFFTDDINKHWDGKANRGSEIAQQDVYVYVVKLTDNHDKAHKYIGTVTIVK